jgi:hypothetical protein
MTFQKIYYSNLCVTMPETTLLQLTPYLSMKKIILRTLLWSTVTIVLLFVVLVVHIYMVMGPSNMKYHEPMQLSRIDFIEPNDSLMRLAEARIRANKNIKHSFINAQQGTLVYGYVPSTVDPQAIFASLSDMPIQAKPFVADKVAVASGCPVMDKSSMTYRLGAYIQSFF